MLTNNSGRKMRRRAFINGAAYALPFCAALSGADAQTPSDLPELPKPRTQGGKPLLSALSERKTNRSVSDRGFSAQLLSDLLWAAFGVNRSEGNLRTAPTAVNVQEIDIYVFLPQAVYLFDAPTHSLKRVLAGDHRAATGSQAGVEKAAVDLLYVADLRKYTSRASMRITDPAQQWAWSNAHAGFIGQNAYLFAASEGLAAWFRALIDAPALSRLLRLNEQQRVLYAQTVGYPARA